MKPRLILLFLVLFSPFLGNRIAAKEVYYTDEILLKSLEKGEAILLYMWNPFMPYSITGIDEVKEFAQSYHLNVEIILDATYFGPLPERDVADYFIHDSADFYISSSSYLFSIKAMNHFPSYILVQKDRINYPTILFGYSSLERLEKFLQENLIRD